MSYLADLQAYLIAQVPATFTATNTFADRMPATPEAAMCLLGSAGAAAQYTADGGKLTRPGLVVIVRHQNSETARAWLSSIEAAFKSISNTTLNGTKYLAVRPTNEASPAAWTNLSITLTQNYEVMRSE